MTLVYDYLEGVKIAAVKSYVDATDDHRSHWTIKTGYVGETAAIVCPKPYTDFELHMPAMPIDGKLTKKEVERLTGYWLHEVLGHAVQTDFKVWDEAVKLGLSQELNAIEDVRIERGIVNAGKYPNAKRYLEALCESIAYKAAKENFDWTDDRAFLSSIAYIGRVELLGYNVPSLPAFSALKPHIQTALRRVLDAIAKTSSGKSGTYECLEIAKTLKNAVNSARQQQQQGQGQGQASGQQGQQGKEQQGDAGQTQKAQTGSGSSGQGSRGQDTPQKGEGGSGAGKARSAGFDDALATKPTDISERFGMTKRYDANEAHADEKQRQQFSAGQISSWCGQAEYPMPTNQHVDDTVYAKLKNMLKGNAKLRTDIKNIVSAPDRVSFERYLEAGRLDTRLAAKMRAGSTRVFKRRQEEDGTLAAVYFLVDISPSMRSNARNMSAATLAIHMAEAVEQAGAKIEVAGFDDENSSNSSVLRIAKPFNKKTRACAASMANLAFYQSSGTNMSPAIIHAAKKLMKVSATRHILFVLTDGNCDYRPLVCKDAALVAESMGAEVIGFGVGIDVSRSFRNAIKVSDDMDDIARTGLGVLARQLAKKAA